MNFKPILTAIVVAALTSTGVNARTDVFRTKSLGPKMGHTVLKPDAAAKNKATQATTLAATSNIPEGTVLYEDFEEWDGTTQNYVPEGWTVVNKKLPAGHPGWNVYPPDPLDPTTYPSNTFIFFLFEEPVDTWFISPEFEVAEGMVITADIHNAGTYYFEMDADPWTSLINSIEKRNDFIINISTDGGQTWEPIHSMADELLSEGYTRAYEYFDRMGWEKVEVDLAEFAGKKAQIAFQVVGDPESNSSGVDNIRVGYPTVDVSYLRPAGALFYGLTNQDQMLPATVMVVPAHSPVTFLNSSNATGNVNYTWTFDTEDVESSVDNDGLTLIYGTSGIGDLHAAGKAATEGKDYDMPVLTATGKNVSATSFSLPGFLQVGGVGATQITVDNVASTYNFGLTVADPWTEGTSTYADIAVPYFGYNVESDRYWTTYTFDITNSEYDQNYRNDPDNKAELTHYGNMFFTSEAPIVINAIRSMGYGLGTGLLGNMNGVQFKAEIYLMKDSYDEFGNFQGYEISQTPDYTVPGTVKMINRNATNYILNLTFTPDEPIVISSADCPAYLVAITGFHDPDHVDYFSPELSLFDNPEGIVHGFYGIDVTFDGQKMPKGWGYVFRHCIYNREPVGQQNRSFFIMLDAAYPWLERADKSEEAIDLSSGSAVSVPLDSYHDAGNLTIEGVPEWLKAEVTGRYDKAVLTLEPIGEGTTSTITLKGHGVSKDINVVGTSGINDIYEDVDGEAVYYDLRGIRVDKPEKGQILVKVKGSTSTKVAIR